MRQDETSDSQSAASEGRTAKSEGLREKLITTLMGFILTGVIGTMVATWFQQRGWAWQNAVARVEKDTTSALASLQSASDLLDKRWSATFQMLQTIQNAKAGDVSKAATDSFLAVNHEWELGYAKVDAAVQFDVDRPFGINANRVPNTLWKLQCVTFPFGNEAGGAVEPNAAHTVLKVIDHCHDLVKTNIDDVDKASADQTSRKKLIDESYLRLSHIYHINDVLRCMILERAITMRRSLDAELGWGSFFWIGPQKYRVPSKEGECVARYREWSEENTRKQP
jgi:hypothetical protein